MSRTNFSNSAGLAAYCEMKTVALDGTSGNGAGPGTVALFTVTGAVYVRLCCICTEDLASAGGGTVEVGVSGSTTLFIAQCAATAVDVGEVWHDGTPDATTELWSVTATTAERILGNGQDILITVGTANVTDGTLTFTAFWTPLTPGATVVAA